MNQKPITPEGHAGVFQSYSEVPARYRLHTYAQYYQGETTYDDYLEEVYFPSHDPVSETLRTRTNRARDSWLEHMDERSNHHALATPDDVNQWCQSLLDSCSIRTGYEIYFSRIYNFYDHLKTNYQHPHLYNPLLLAAIEYDSAFQIWNYRVKDRPTNSQ